MTGEEGERGRKGTTGKNEAAHVQRQGCQRGRSGQEHPCGEAGEAEKEGREGVKQCVLKCLLSADFCHGHCWDSTQRRADGTQLP